MPKNNFFTGQPVFSQLLSLIPNDLFISAVHLSNSDRYYKNFKTYDHLVTMLYACYHRCSSLREVVTGIQASYNKLGHLGLSSVPRRSTLSEANARRSVGVFEALYHQLYKHFYGNSPDSRYRGGGVEKRLFIMDSTTVSLFTDIMKGAGCPAADGKRKGGAKAHVLLDAANDIPAMISLTASARNDRIFMPSVKLPVGSILVFDKGYHHFARWQQWSQQKINWVTRIIDKEAIEILEQRPISALQKMQGLLGDERIILGKGTNKSTQRIQVRLVTYQDPESGKLFRFLTNNFKFSPFTVADIYKKRWQIELFFKRFKQHNPLRLFLGDNENAIKIQLWCSFIADLLIKVVKDNLRRKWSFANLSAIIRHHLMNYLHLKDFLNDPDRVLQKNEIAIQHNLFPT